MTTRSKLITKSSSDTATSEDELGTLRADFEAFKTENAQQFRAVQAQTEAVHAKTTALEQSVKDMDSRMSSNLGDLRSLLKSLVDRSSIRQPAGLGECSQGKQQTGNCGKEPVEEKDELPDAFPTQGGRFDRTNSHCALREPESSAQFDFSPRQPRRDDFEGFAQNHARRTNPLREERPYGLGNEVPLHDFRTEAVPRGAANLNFDFYGDVGAQVRGDPRFRKLEIPLFNGNDVNEWIVKFDWYVRVNRLTDPEALAAAIMCLEGKAFKWYAWYSDMRPIQSWEELKDAIIHRFRGADRSEVQERFLLLVQDKSVMRYRERFEELAGVIKGIPDEMLKANFLKGLKPEIRAAVKVHKPRTLMDTMDLAQLIEEKEGSSNRTSNSRPSNPPNNRHGGAPRPNQPRDQQSRRPPDNRPQQPQRPAQGDQKKRDNRCYKCSQPWEAGHQCAERALRVMEGSSDDEEEQTESVEVSLNSLSGLTPARAMKVKGDIGSREVTILIDSGATHNFISSSLVQEEGLKVLDKGSFTVKLGTRVRDKGRGLCPDVKIRLPGYTVKADFLPLDLEGSDAILGMQWLETLGDMKVNWGMLKMEFKSKGRRVRLLGEPALKKAEVSLQSIVKGQKSISECYLVEARQLNETQVVEAIVPEAIQSVISEFPEVFEEPQGLPPNRGFEHSIVLKEGAAPVSVRPYRYAQVQKDEIEKMVKEMLQAGIIRPSSSPFSSPVLLVKKKDGGWRFCVDYRALNKQTVPDKFPIPVIDELLDELHGSVMFSKIDLKSGYHQIRMSNGDERKTAFRTHEGQYEFLVMPFGLTNAPATFQALMNKVFKPWLRKFVLVFFDDILIYSKSEEEHEKHLRLVLAELRKHQLSANLKKCLFGKDSVEYLGHVVSKDGVSADQLKIKAMQDWPVPRTIRQLRGFLGLTGYYRKFVKNYGKLAQPLTEQLKKDSFKWSEAATEAFQALKKAMTEVPVLALPDFSKPFIIETDASGYGLGAVLMQDKRPLAYWSQVLSARARQKSVYERELMAIALAVTKWRPYLLGRHFIVRTDQRSLKYLLEQRLVSEEHQKWLTKLLGFDFEIHYKPGLENKAADALSRKVEVPVPADEPHLEHISIHRVMNWPALYKENESPLLDKFREAMKQGDTRYTMSGSHFLYKGRFILPKSSDQIPTLFQEFHGSVIGGHSGVLKTYKRIASEFYWEGMKKDIQQRVAACEECQRSKYAALAPAGLLQPLEIPAQVWADISMDFIEGLPKSEDFSSIMVVVDRLSKYSHFIPLKHPFTAVTIAEIFIKEIVRLHGIPESIVSDRDAIFISNFWKHLFKALGTSLKRSTAYHPQTDGQTEVVNRSIGTYLRCFAATKQREWVKYLPWAEYWYNTCFHTSAQTTPFRVLYGRDPPRLLPYEKGSVAVQQVEQQLLDRDQVLAELKEHLKKARQQMKVNADKHRRDVEFKVGDYVYVKMQPGRQLSMIRKDNAKLAYKFYGPYQIERRIGAVAYRLKFPKQVQVYPVFHVSQLKPASGPPKDPRRVNHLKWYHALQSIYQPEGLRGVRHGPDGREVLLKWTKMPEYEATWELAEDIEARFPDFDLEDKIVLWEAGPDAFSHPSQSHYPAHRGNRTNQPAEGAKGPVQRKAKGIADDQEPIELDQVSLEESRQLKTSSDQLEATQASSSPAQESEGRRIPVKDSDCPSEASPPASAYLGAHEDIGL